ncbi:PAS domain-containing protein (plasmid) [Burkholderia thailandensis]|uniref:hybrid sensor histidine kinase/response regulator n=1 Tax=Burkholderia thailandensis TaxID=57975 RepID=UPI00192DFBF2|nr:PAS domain-containing protein [Burkholderia thailandensis]MBS2132306.1 PAS domain-containing protein [Burkholderia thailandensis]QRA15116.1 PAS domain-containing protein [Burkholderia thailandensis]
MNTLQEVQILLVEDSPSDTLLIGAALADVQDFRHRLVRAERLSDALARTGTTHFDVVLLDLGLPDAQGLETFRTFHREVPDLPVLVLTGLDDMSVGLLAIQAGAQDYLTKRDIRPTDLSRAIRYAIERHRAAIALKESEERFQLAISGATAGLWDWNPQTGAIYLSPHFKEILGYDGDELPDQMRILLEAIHPDDIDRVKASLTAHLEHGHAYDVEYRMRSRSDGFRWIQSRGQALWNHAGEPYRMVGWIMDVTDRKRADVALRESREELQHLSANVQHLREEEKTRVARELHDDLGQQLTALQMEVSNIENHADAPGTALVGADLHNIYALINQLVVSVRQIATDLRPAMLDDLGVIPAIEWFTDQFSARYGVRVIRHIGGGDIDFNRESSTALYRIVQEALTNVARHSGATVVTLEIARRDPDCIVSIVDDGRGCASDRRPARNSFGLLGMRERVAGLGGDLQIRTAPDQGFALSVSLPLAGIEGEHGK